MKKIVSLIAALALVLLSCTAFAETEAFDAYARPKVVEAPKVAMLIRSADSESQLRSRQQGEIECAHRGWEFLPIVYEMDTNFRDAFQNAMNQGVDAIIINSTESLESRLDLIESARNAGVGIYCNDVMVVDGVIMNSTMPNGVAAMELLYRIGEDYGWKLNMCTVDYNAQQITVERNEGVKAFAQSAGCYPDFTYLASDDPMVGPNAGIQAAYDIAQAWLQQYGEDVNFFWSCADIVGIPVAEAISQNGDPTGEKAFTCGFDGGLQAWSYIRNNTPFKYSYAQPFELYVHKVFEAINDIQVKGINPGDEGCCLSFCGETLYSTGGIVTQANCPAVGTNIHEIFDYYNPDDTEAWYTWTDGPGPYMVEEYAG